MIGRDQQLAKLEEVFNIVRAGQGRVACVLGEPGLGKSRLLAELHASLRRSGAPVRWIDGRCLSYGETVPYHLVVDVVRSLIGVNAAADEAHVAQALETQLRRLAGDTGAENYAYLAHLLSLPLAPEMQARVSILEMEAIKRYVASLVNVLRAMSARGPIVLVCDDVHWADSASVDVLLQVEAGLAALPVFLILSSRVERASAGWRLISGARDVFGDALTEIRLEPLSLEGSRTLVSNLLHIDSLPVEIRDLILATAEGHPFFVEEVIRMLMDRGAIVQEADRWVATERVATIEIPDTTHGLLLARIDKLPRDSKRTLRVASVIGRQFGVTILERLLDTKTS